MEENMDKYNVDDCESKQEHINAGFASKQTDDDEKSVPLTLSLTVDDEKLLKMRALQEEKTIEALIHEGIESRKMDVELTRISLPTKHYLLLLGTALSVFSSNNGFIIENICNTDDSYSWHKLIDKESGQLKEAIKNTITKEVGPEIANKFDEVVSMRNRIIHGFRITSSDGEQILATKERRNGIQFEITEEYLLRFIHLNNELADVLYQYRGY